MKKATKIWLAVASSLVVVGLAMFAVVMTKYHWDFTKLSTVNYETNTFDIDEEFKNISIDTDTADIRFALSENGKCRVECYEEEKANHAVTVREDTLVIQVIDDKSWYDYIGINHGSPKITVYLPKMEYASLFIEEGTGDIQIPKDYVFERVDISLSTGDVKFSASTSDLAKIKATTGDIKVEDTTAGMLDLSVSTGMVTVSGVTCQEDVTVGLSTGEASLQDIACKNVLSSGSTGDISLKNVIASEKFSIDRSTGDVKFENSDAAEIIVKTDTGDVTGTLLTDKVFVAKTDTGRVDVPNTVTGGRCEIITDTGDIKIKTK